MTVRVGINGLGRVGRAVLRAIEERRGTDVEVVAVNDLADTATLAHLLRHDSTYGPWPEVATSGGSRLSVRGRPVRVFAGTSPEAVDWSDEGVEVVVEATGRFRRRDQAVGHLRGDVASVVLTSPGKDVDLTVVMGLNDGSYRPGRHRVISNASCTTNCAAPMLHVLHRAFGVRGGLLTTVHSYTADQRLQDAPHADLRRARAAATNMIPTSTGAARAVETIIPELAGRLDGLAVRVPLLDVSLVDLVVTLEEPVGADEVVAAFETAAAGELKGYLTCATEPIVSSDVLRDPSSCVFDPGLTRVAGGLVKVFGWYDNEWGYAQRTVDVLELVAAGIG